MKLEAILPCRRSHSKPHLSCKLHLFTSSYVQLVRQEPQSFGGYISHDALKLILDFAKRQGSDIIVNQTVYLINCLWEAVIHPGSPTGKVNWWATVWVYWARGAKDIPQPYKKDCGSVCGSGLSSFPWRPQPTAWYPYWLTLHTMLGTWNFFSGLHQATQNSIFNPQQLHEMMDRQLEHT